MSLRDQSFPSDSTPGVDFAANPGDHIAARAAGEMAVTSKQLGKRIHGQIAVETEAQDLQVLFCSYPNGDFYVWFIEGINFVLLALVDERMKCIGIIQVDQNSEFLRLVNSVANQLNMKHGYPVEQPEDFQPSSENPPDTSANG